MYWKLPHVQAGFRKGRWSRDQIAKVHWVIEKAREFQKNIYFCCIDYAKAFDCVDYNKLWKILREMGISDRITCLLKSLYTGQETTVRTRHETMDWFKIGKGGHQDYIVTLFLCRVHHVKCWAGGSTGWKQDGGRNINNLRYADDTTVRTESEEELKSILMKVKEESEKAGFKHNIHKTKITASNPIIHGQ